MSNKEINGLSPFALKAMKKLEAKKDRKKVELYVPSLEQNITVQSITETEFYEYSEMSEEENGVGDLYTLYNSVVEPNLQEVAKELKENGDIVEFTEVCNMFDLHERRSIVQEILVLSGIYSENGVKLVMTDALKK